jgi:phosphate transport system substrate-binding protein
VRRPCHFRSRAGLCLALLAGAAGASDAAPVGAAPYVAATPNVHGVVRIHDSELTQALVHLWQDRFLKLHPLVRYKEYTVPAWFNGLCAGTADLAFAGRRAYRTELKAFESVYGYPPTEIVFATGGFNKRKGNTPGVIIFVHQDNPLAGLTIDQLDGILGAERTGGWVGTQWTTAVSRGPEKNIRTWGQLGLTGEWADKPISIFGIDATLSGWSGLIQQVVFKGGDKWNPVIHEIVRGGTEVPADAQIVNGVAADRYAIGFSFMRVVEQNPGVKPVALAREAGQPFVIPTEESFFARSYPLATSVYIYLNRPPGRPLAPRLKEFLTFILSREGQQAVAEEGMYIPLNPQAAQAELRKLD